MKLFIIAALIAIAAAGRLENTYLPPNSAHSAGGHEHDLNSPTYNSHYSAKHEVKSTYSTPTDTSDDFQHESAEGKAATLRFENENNGDGSYKFEFETENKISQQETGELKNIGTEQEGSSVQGSYSYEGTDGVLYTIHYIADENGFRATGDHLPTPPPVPEAIRRSLDKISAESHNFDSNQHTQVENNGYEYNREHTASRQYLAPNNPSYNQQNGYKY